MLPVAALPIFVRFFDGIDNAVAKKLVRKVPWDETSITRELCDLLDEDYSDECMRPYPLEHFRRDLARIMPLARFDLKIDTHQYSSPMESWVTQSDIGVVLNYDDRFQPQDSWQSWFLLQAKRLFPQNASNQYTQSSKFGSTDPAQHKRIIDLNSLLGCDLVKYLLYCPRPTSLDEVTAAQLTHLRNKSLNSGIFDFADGLALYRELESGGQTLAAGVFVARTEPLPTTLASTHRGIFDSTLPLSWLLALEFADFAGIGDLSSYVVRGVRCDPLGQDVTEIVQGIVVGDERVTQGIATLAGRDADFAPLRVLPKHTIRVTVSPGGLASENQRLIIDQ